MSEKRIYELTAQDKLNSDDYFAVDKSGNATAKKVPGSVIVDQFADMQNIYGSKNLVKFPYSEVTKTVSGVTVTNNGDGSITVNGTATADVRFYYIQTTDAYNPLEKGKSYIISNPFATENNSIRGIEVALYNGNTFTGHVWYQATEKEKLFTVPSNAVYDRITAYFLIVSGQTVNNLTFWPMLRAASITDDTWVPFAKTNKQLTEDVTELNSALTNKLVATANANQTYAAQTAYLESYFDNLSDSQKVNSYIEQGGYIFRCVNTNSKIFSFYQSGSSGTYLYSQCIYLSAHTQVELVNTTAINNASTISSSPMKLYTFGI